MVVTRSRNEARGLAKQEKLAREQAVIERENVQDTLARSLYEQARAVRLVRSAGHRLRVLELLKQAESLRTRSRESPIVDSEGLRGTSSTNALPTLGELRTEALRCALNPDAHIVREWSGFSQAHAVSSGRTVCMHGRYSHERIGAELPCHSY